jgi:CheY-like chemotaxis protein
MSRRAPRARSMLRTEVEAAALQELERVGPAAFRRTVVVEHFLGRGASRSTLFRWVERLVASGRAGQHLALQIKEAAAASAAHTTNAAAARAGRAAQRLPKVVNVDDVALAGGTIGTIGRIKQCIAAAEAVMATAHNSDGSVRSAKLLLAASDHLRRAVETAWRLQQACARVAELERFHRAILDVLTDASPEIAEAVVRRLAQLSEQWEP